MDELSITTDRLLITEFSEDMAESVHRNSLDDDNRRFVPDEVFPTVEAAQEVIRFLISCYRGTDGPFVYPVLLKSGENIGYVQAVCLGEAWEIGYHIAAPFTSRGFAAEAVKAFLTEIMPRLGIDEIWGICRGGNTASRRVLEKCGFELVFSGRGDYQGEEHEVCRYVYRHAGEGVHHGQAVRETPE